MQSSFEIYVDLLLKPSFEIYADLLLKPSRWWVGGVEMKNS